MNNGPQLVTETPSTGRTLAAVLAAAVGCAAMGVFTFLAAMNKSFNSAVTFYKPSGALSGEATLSVIAWLAGWVFFAKLWRGRSPQHGFILVASYLLLLFGLLTTFPPFLHLFVAR